MGKMDGVFIKIFVDDLERYQKLSDAEYGRLVRAGLAYRATFAEPSLSGRESLMWDGMKLDIDRDIQRYENIKSGRSEAGKKGMAKRWQNITNDNKNNKRITKDNKNNYDKDIDIDKDIDGNVSLTESHRAGADLDGAIKEFISFRKQIKKPMTERAVSMLKTKLEKLAPGDNETKIRILEKSIYKGWTDVYELDDGRPEPSTKTSNPFLEILMKEGDAL